MDDQKFQEHQNLNRAAIDYAAATLRGLLLTNGAAAIAVLGLSNNLILSEAFDVGAIAGSILIYAWGVASAVLACGTSYLTNYSLAGCVEGVDRWCCAGRVFQVVSILLAVTSLVSFLAGSYAVKNALAANL